MINGWKQALKAHPEVRISYIYVCTMQLLTSSSQIDADRTVAAGASWGGYAIKCVLLGMWSCSNTQCLDFSLKLDTRSPGVRFWFQG